MNDNITIATDHFKTINGNTSSKRNVLKACGMLFDPLGILAPITIRIKLLMQQLLKIGISWDESLQPDFHIVFQEWLEEVIETQAMIIPRQYFEDPKF